MQITNRKLKKQLKKKCKQNKNNKAKIEAKNQYNIDKYLKDYNKRVYKERVKLDFTYKLTFGRACLIILIFSAFLSAIYLILYFNPPALDLLQEFLYKIIEAF